MNRIALALAPVVFRTLTGLLFGFCRIDYRGPGCDRLFAMMRAGEPMVLSFWHYCVIFIARHRPPGGKWAAMVSASRDGEYIARIMEGVGIRPVRGSRNRGGVAALKSMLEAMRDGCFAAIVADGSQGPARQAQPGAVLLASRSGRPLAPVSCSADRYWAFGSWDRTILPKPFARVTIHIGELIEVPAGLKAEELEPWRERFEQALAATYAAAWREQGREGH